MKGLRIIIADSNPETCRNLKSMLIKAGYIVVGIAEEGYQALKYVRSYQPDLVIIGTNLAKITAIELAGIIEDEKLAPVLLLTSTYEKDFLIMAQDVLISGYIIKPINEYLLTPTIELTISNYKRYLNMERYIKTLESKLETRKVLERAKGILMNNLQITESEAFRRIQKQSMNKRKSMRSIAEAILVAEDFHS